MEEALHFLLFTLFSLLALLVHCLHTRKWHLLSSRVQIIPNPSAGVLVTSTQISGVSCLWQYLRCTLFLSLFAFCCLLVFFWSLVMLRIVVDISQILGYHDMRIFGIVRICGYFEVKERIGSRLDHNSSAPPPHKGGFWREITTTVVRKMWKYKDLQKQLIITCHIWNSIKKIIKNHSNNLGLGRSPQEN